MKTRINKGRSDSSSQHKFGCFLRATASWKTRITVSTLLWLVTCALALAQGAGDTAYVTLVHPDGTRAFYPLQANPSVCDRGAKLQQAKTDAQSGDTIIVGPGDAWTNNLLKNGVNWHFTAGAKVIGECCQGQTGCTANVGGTIFTDGPAGTNGPITCIISGEGTFESATRSEAMVIALVDDSHVSFTANSILGPKWGAISSQKATLHIKANTITCNDPAYHPAILWSSGALHVQAHEILSKGVVIQSSAVSGENLGDYLWIEANLIKSTGGSAALNFNDSEPTTRQWIQALQIQGIVAIRKEQTSGPGFTYVRAQKIFGQIDHQAGSLYVDALKIAAFMPPHLNDNLIKLSGGNSWINILQIDDFDLEDSTHPVAAVAVSAGTHYLRGSSLARVSAGDGINVSGGILTVNGLTVSTLEGSRDLMQTGGTLKALSCGYSLKKTSGAITEGNPKVGILGTAAFEARDGGIDQNGVFNGIIGLVTQLGRGQYEVRFSRSEPDTNYMVTATAESETGAGTVCFWSSKSTDGFVLNLVDAKSLELVDQNGVRVTVSRIP